ncbi:MULTISPECIES: non-ribosomal peptide synthetase [Bacillus]|uniref:non-ribosomal peptide synthetase n=1 Tax=Bacillus TaxID=1386 RepID=UPI00122C2DD9|nr:non-ribosomal peptide synthetase [Bacillus cereus]EKS7875520.1 amino acid adenylation domain-containing protein [Bacillus cereus]KAA1804896.1 Gramicidin S synthase 2 [Bacillus cereus]MDF9473306.1 amino acid adenylation domain-containing protein [Bacillus cereus]HDR7724216.1 amino acid adenylation domain-containing protein [Bacillus cereus]
MDSVNNGSQNSLLEEDLFLLPTSSGQQRLWFLDQFLPLSATYNISFILKFKGDLNMNALQKSLLEIISRHEILRTTFVTSKDKIMQLIHPSIELDFNVTVMKQENIREEAMKIAEKEAKRPFNLQKGPLLRTRILELEKNEHWLILNIHHIVFDGWSTKVFFKELSTLYEGYVLNKPVILPELPIQYADYSLWQHELLQSDNLKEQLEYWNQQLGDKSSVLELPTDYTRPKRQTYRGNLLKFNLPKDLSDKLHTLSHQEDSTLFMTLLAAFKTLLYRYTGQENLLIGTPIANRQQEEIENLIGFFVNTLILKTDLSNNPSFRELLQRVRDTTLNAYSHQDLPFEILVEKLQPERDASYSPLFQVMFTEQNSNLSVIQLPELTMSVEEVYNGTSKFDLTMFVSDERDGIVISIEYNSNLFDESTIRRMANHYQTLLESIVANVNQSISELPIMEKEEITQLLSKNDYSYNEPVTDICIQTLFELQVQKTPDAIAAIYGDQRITYRELNEQANRLGHYLRRSGVKSDTLVGLCVERSLSMIIGILGILKAGGAYVPLDPTYPKERLSFMLKDSHVTILVTEEHLVQEIQPHQTRMICIDKDWCEIKKESSKNPSLKTHGNDLAYVIYTSGSTGNPKGCLVQHDNVVRLFTSTNHRFHFNENDVWTLFHSYAFDFSVWEIWGALLHGGRLVVVPPSVARSPEDFYKLLIKERVTILNQTPSAFWQLDQVDKHSSLSDCLSLRLIIFGGERLEFSRLRSWMERHEGEKLELVNMYGITETTVHVTYRKITKEDIKGGSRSYIGEPLSDLDLYVLDSYLQPVPVGVVGELYVGGAGVTRGYHNRPNLESERFITNPFSPDTGARLYRTGDQVRRLSNGDYDYVGRIDSQVKIRGFRIELNEIEANLREHPMIKESVVVHSIESNISSLVAYVVPNEGDVPSSSELYNFLKDKIPAFMVPAVYEVLPALPITSNGKVDKKALPKPNLKLVHEPIYAPPEHPIEVKLSEIWSNVLNIDSVGIDHNFFQIGGDSIRSIQVIAIARKSNIHLTIEQIFSYPTIRELALVVQLENKRSQEEQYQPFSLLNKDDRSQMPGGVEDAYPLTHLQRGMIFHSEYSQGGNAYHHVISLHIRAPFNKIALEEALDKLVQKHPTIRTSFALTEFSEPIQLVQSSLRIPLMIKDISHLNQEHQSIELENWWNQELNVLDWKNPPLLRCSVHRRCEETFQLTICDHHSIIDGWSIAILITELLGIYNQLILGATTEVKEFDPLNLTFAEYVRLEKEAASSLDFESFWEEELANCSVTKIPRWSTKELVHENINNSLTIPISKDIQDGLKNLALESYSSLRTVLLSAHIKVLSMLSGQSDVLTGLVLHGRPETSDSDRLIGLFLNTIPLRIQLEGGTWVDLVQSVRDAEGKVLPYRRYPLSKIFQINGGNQLFETMFNYTHFHVYDELEQQTDIKIIEKYEKSSPLYPFVVDFTHDTVEDKLQLVLTWDPSEFDETQLDMIAKYYIRTLNNMVTSSYTHHDEQSLLSFEEKNTVLIDWNDTKDSYEQDIKVHQLFERQVMLTPDKIAIVDKDIRLNYRDLNIRANKLAHYLQNLGVKQNTLVGLYLDKSVDAVVSILAVLKAGGAYIPLDPDYPKERISHMLAEASVEMIVTWEHLSSKLSSQNVNIIQLDKDYYEIHQESCENPINISCNEDLAYVIFTSGSTGKPKGAMNIHGGLTAAYHAWDKAYDLSEISCNLQMTSFAFDVFTADVFRTLCSGGKLLLCPKELLLDAPKLYELICQEHVQFAFFLPAIMRNLIRYVEETSKDFTFIKVMVVGADYWYADEYNKLQKICGPQTRVINSYGVAEATVDSIYFEGNGEELPLNNNIPIGRPFANMKAYILGPDLQPLPPGVIGELFIGGACVGLGYINRPELTKERFFDNPFDFEDNSRLYKTGDLARYLPDGKIEFLGRADHQLKIKGFRVELGEIEMVLRELPSVKDAVVLAPAIEPGIHRIIAYVMLTEQDIVEITPLLRSSLRGKLPEYMIPMTFVQIQEVPLTPNGKVDRQALESLDAPSSSFGTKYVPPRNDVEDTVASIMAEVMNVDQVGIFDNFFDLGGESLTALQVIARIRKALQIELPLRSLFASPTVAELSKAIMNQSKFRVDSHPKRIDRNQPLLLSYAQQRLWFFEQFIPGTATYNVPVCIRLTGKLDVVALEKSLIKLVSRHESLRTTFHKNLDEPIQVIDTEFKVDLKFVNLIGLSKTNCQQKTEELLTMEAKKPFELDGGSLFRACLIQLQPEEYILLLTMHHIITDGWSVKVILNDLAIAYETQNKEQQLSWPDPEIQYVDYALWQRELLENQTLDNHIKYWEERLMDAPQLLSLPTDSTRPKIKNYMGSIQKYDLSQQLLERLRHLARSNDVTMFILLIAAFKILLAKYSDQDDILVGTPVTNRSHLETEDTVGFFVNTVILRSKLSEELSFEKFLEQVKATVLEAHAYSDLPFEKLVSILKPERNLSYSPLFQVMFVMEEKSELPSFSNLSIEQMDLTTDTTKCDLTLNLQETSDGLTATIIYDPALFQNQTIIRMLENYEGILENIIAYPDLPIRKLGLTTAHQKQQLLDIGSGPTLNSFKEISLLDIFTRRVARTPEVIACVFEEETLTYRELEYLSNKLANYLLKLGVGPEVKVGLYMERSLDTIIGLLGILKAGGTYVPLDTNYPAERLEFMSKDAQIKALITHHYLTDTFNYDCYQVNIDTEWNRIERESDIAPIININSDCAAYVIYTTGSTGRPKGVVVEHSQIVNYAHAVVKACELEDCQTFAMVQPLTVDSSQTVLFPCFLTGGTLHIITYERALDAFSLANYFRKYPIDCLKIAPSHFAALEATCGAKSFMPKNCLILGGEASLSQWVYSLQEQAPSCRIYNHYGPTETTVGALVYPVIPGEKLKTNTVPIGYPLSNTQVYVLDSKMEPVPWGVTGELYISGNLVSRGYLNHEEFTKERFILNPFQSNSSEKLYRTGDLVRFLSDGTLEFLGRIDDQIKINGYRVEPGEVAATLFKHPEVQDVIVIPKQNGNNENRLIAYLVPTKKHLKPETGEIRKFLQERLPSHLIPVAFVWMDILPRTAHGKIDRKALPNPSVEVVEGYAPPRNPREEILAQIWSEVLGKEQVGIHDNFFDFGGDSIMSMQLTAKAYAVGLHLPPSLLFQYQTISELSNVINEVPEVSSPNPPSVGEVPFTPIQHWFFKQNFSVAHHWNQSLLLEVKESLPPEILQKAVSELILYHDTLRLRFKNNETEWKQEIVEGVSPTPFQFVDFSELAEHEIARVFEKAKQEAQSTLNLTKGPIFRMVYFWFGKNRTPRLLITIHHLAVDSVSWRVLLEDLNSLCEQLLQGEPTRLSPPFTSFHDWAKIMSEFASDESLYTDLQDWKRLLGNSVASLPIDYEDGSNIEELVEEETVILDYDETNYILQKLPSEWGVHVNALLLTALSEALNGWTGRSEMLVDVEGHGRQIDIPNVDVTRTVGWFTTHTPIRLQLGQEWENHSIKERVIHIHQQLKSIPKHGGFGLSMLRYLHPEAGVRDEATSLPKPQIKFNYLGYFDRLDNSTKYFTLSNESAGLDRDQNNHRSHLLNVHAVAKGNKLHVTWSYSKSQYKRSTIKILSELYFNELKKLARPSSKNHTEVQPTNVDDTQENRLYDSALVPFRTGTGKPNFFCVHPITGSVFDYIELARCISKGLNFYGLQSVYLEEEKQCLSSVEEMAHLYIKAIQNVQPKGPYLLGGWSMGGIIAYEMARILEERGQQVSLLAIFDKGTRHVNSEVETLLVNLFDNELPINPKEFAQMTPVNQLDFLMNHPDIQNRFGNINDSSMIRKRISILQNNAKATHEYVPGPYSGHIKLFVSSDTAKHWQDDITLGWKNIVSNKLEHYIVPGDHFTMVKSPQVNILANQLLECIRKIE